MAEIVRAAAAYVHEAVRVIVRRNEARRWGRRAKPPCLMHDSHVTGRGDESHQHGGERAERSVRVN